MIWEHNNREKLNQYSKKWYEKNQKEFLEKINKLNEEKRLVWENLDEKTKEKLIAKRSKELLYGV